MNYSVMRIVVSLFILGNGGGLFGQKYYHVWPYGYDGKSGNPAFSTSYFDLSSGQLKNYKVSHNVNFRTSVASICDSIGSLKLYTNGVAIYNHEGQKIPNGDSLNLGPWYYSDKLYGASLIQDHYFVYNPFNKNEIFLLHESYQKDTAYIIKDGPIYFTKIIRDAKNNFKVSEKNINIFNGEIGRLSICKHGDGKRWWGIVPELKTSKYYFFLIDSSGMHYSHFVKSGLPMFGTYCHAEGMSAISPDGSKYLRWSNVCGVRIFDVDRCTGDLYNAKSIDLDSTLSPGAGSAFSPNSRFVYICSNTSIYQIDTQADQPKLLEVAKYDNYVDNFSTTFFLMDLQPDGKIYINTNNGNTKLHVIEFPDSAGVACQVKQHSVQLASLMAFTLPRTPNHLLGVLKGSPCDTSTSTTSVPVFPGGFVLYPNPALERLTIELDDGLAHEQSYQVKLYGLQGITRYKGVMPAYSYVHTIDVQNLASGMYILELSDREGKVLRRKFVKE